MINNYKQSLIILKYNLESKVNYKKLHQELKPTISFKPYCFLNYEMYSLWLSNYIQNVIKFRKCQKNVVFKFLITWSSDFSNWSLLLVSHETNYRKNYKSCKHAGAWVHTTYYKCISKKSKLFNIIYRFDTILLTCIHYWWIYCSFLEQQGSPNPNHMRRKFE